MAASEITLPLMCKAIHLAELPGAPSDKRYAVIWGGGLRQPAEGMGYVFEMTGKRTGRPLAWIRDGGYAYAVDGLLVSRPPALPVIELALWRNRPGTGTVKRRFSHDGSTSQAAEFRVVDDGYRFQDPLCDLGEVYSSASCRLAEFLAVSFLAFWYLPRRYASEHPSEPTMGDVLDKLLDYEIADAVDLVIAEVASGERSSGFERYAARILGDLDPRALRSLTARHHVGWRRLKTTGLFWFAYDLDNLDSREAELLVAYEGAFNRLALIARRAHEAGTDALALSSEAHCADADWYALRTIARQGASLLGSVQGENKLMTFAGVRAAYGGEWDIRTRLAQTLEHLVLPYRLMYRFSCSAEAGAIKIIASVPPAGAMPRWRRGERARLDAARGAAHAASAAYGVRLLAVLAEAAFGAGTGIARARVVLCRDLDLQAPLADARFERIAFISGAHEHVTADDFSDPSATLDAERLIGLLEPAPCTVRIDHAGAFIPLGAPDAVDLDAAEMVSDPDLGRKVPLAEDRRPLPPELAGYLHADTVSELDIFHVGDDPFAERVRAAAALSHSDPRAAAQQLSDLIDVMDLMHEVNDLPGEPGSRPARRPLYCSNNMARLAMALEDADPSSRYSYVLDSAYDARVLLSRLCTENDDPEHGLGYALDAVALGPTSSQAYIAAATAYAALHRFDEAVAALRHALRYEALPATASYLYYRLAFALWQGGDPRAGLACYERVLPNAHMRPAAVEEMRALMAQNGMEHELTPEEVSAELARAQVPEEPSGNLVDLARTVMIRACDAGLFNVANMYKQALAGVAFDDATVAALSSFAPWRPGRQEDREPREQ